MKASPGNPQATNSSHPIPSASLGAALLLGLAGTAFGQNQPVVYPSSVDAGAGRSTVNNVSLDATIGGFGGLVASSDGSVQCHVGFSGQLLKIRPVLVPPYFSFPATVHLPLFGEDDRRYRVQTSTTLRTNSWTTLWTGRTTFGVAVITQPGVALEHHRFYRATEIR